MGPLTSLDSEPGDVTLEWIAIKALASAMPWDLPIDLKEYPDTAGQLDADHLVASALLKYPSARRAHLQAASDDYDPREAVERALAAFEGAEPDPAERCLFMRGHGPQWVKLCMKVTPNAPYVWVGLADTAVAARDVSAIEDAEKFQVLFAKASSGRPLLTGNYNPRWCCRTLWWGLGGGDFDDTRMQAPEDRWVNFGPLQDARLMTEFRSTAEAIRYVAYGHHVLLFEAFLCQFACGVSPLEALSRGRGRFPDFPSHGHLAARISSYEP